MNAPSTPLEALEEFKFTIPLSIDHLIYLRKLGYEERNGDGMRDQNHIVIQPFKKWFWKQYGASGVIVNIQKHATVVYSLDIEQK